MCTLEPEDTAQDVKVLVNPFCTGLSNPFMNLLGLDPQLGNELDSSVSFGNELPSKKLVLCVQCQQRFPTL